MNRELILILKKHVFKRMDECDTVFRMITNAGGYSPNTTYKVWEAFLVGKAQKFGNFLLSQTDLTYKIDKSLL